jgi:hypothetical protein
MSAEVYVVVSFQKETKIETPADIWCLVIGF